MSCHDDVVAMQRMAQHLALKSRALGNDFVAYLLDMAVLALAESSVDQPTAPKLREVKNSAAAKTDAVFSKVADQNATSQTNRGGNAIRSRSD